MDAADSLLRMLWSHYARTFLFLGMPNTPEFIVFSGFNDRAVIAFCRSATKHQVGFHIVARSGDDKIFQTRYADKVVLQRDTLSLGPKLFGDAVSAIRHKGVESSLIYVPTTEYLNRYVLAHRQECESLGLETDLVDQELYQSLSDKGSFYRLCRSARLPVPKQDTDPSGIGFLCVAKPKTYFGSGNRLNSKPVFLDDIKQMNDFRVKYVPDDYVFQEYVQGDSYYLLYYCSKAGDIVSYSQRNLIQQHEGGSIVAAVPDRLHQEEMGSEYRKLLKRMGFTGFVMIELRKRADQYFMIEANPRLWGPIQLTLDASVGLFEAYFRDHGYDVCRPRTSKASDVAYFWMGGLLSTSRAGYSCLFHSFSPSELCRSFDRWLESDVWKRPDSISIFLSELALHEK
jgi:predicted ATP-grasp superfamily ATP-dependent carboligase